MLDKNETIGLFAEQGVWHCVHRSPHQDASQTQTIFSEILQLKTQT